MKSLVLGSLSLVLLLAACGRSPGFTSRSVNFGDASQVAVLQQKFTGTDQLVIKSEPVPEATKALVKRGTLSVGDRIFTAGAFTDNMFAWTITSPCAALPQGNAVNLHHELYDANGAVLQKNTSPVTVTISTC